jgi:flagellar hook-length control protein FliK
MANASNTIPSVLTNATSPITDVAQLSAQTNTDTAANLSAALSGDSSGQANALSANLASSLSALTAKSDTPSALTPEQMAAMSPLQMTANQPLASSDKLTPNVGSPAWDQALGTKVTWMVAGGQQNATLNLNPPDLGPMQVVINVTNAHANASFTAHQPEVRAALENAIPKLREMLGQAGIQLGECSVGGQQAQFQQQNPSSSQQTNSGRTSNASLSDSIGGIAGIVGDIGPRTGSTQRGNGLVDTFV